MQESTGPKNKKDNDASDSEATSKDQLSDIADAEKNSGSSSSEVDPGPSPDGAFDENKESKDSGPM